MKLLPLLKVLISKKKEIVQKKFYIKNALCRRAPTKTESEKMKNIKNAQGIPKLLGKYSGHIITDDVPIIELTEHIMEEKLSLLLLDLYFHGNIEFYSGQYNNKFACKYFDNDEKILYRSFELTKVSNCILKLCHPFDCSCNTYRASNNLLK